MESNTDVSFFQPPAVEPEATLSDPSVPSVQNTQGM